MDFWAQVEADFNAVIASADSIPTKLENLVGIQTRAQQMTALTAQVTAILEDGSQTNDAKVTAILTAVGKL